MSDPHAKEPQGQVDMQPTTKLQERRAQPRAETVLAQIEDATYAILRKHENKSA